MANACPKCRSENPPDTSFCGKCGTPLTRAQDAVLSKTMTVIHPSSMSKGAVLAGKYRILEPIGRGGMGVVYKAEDLKLERMVALKFLPAELNDDPEARERFVREAKAAAALPHAHICTIHEIAEDEGQSFIVMEYIEGQSLRQKLLKGPLDQAEALDIAIQAAEGLDEAHKKGIVHRDIKPGNIMLTGKGAAKIMDFGLAKVLGGSLITREAKTIGTVAYMSPEQAQGEAVDQRTDIWSLGIVLYEMLTGQLPFKGEFEQSMIHSILSHEPEPLTKFCPGLPKEAQNVVLTALAKNPADRYRSMEDLLGDLKALAEGLRPLRARPSLLRGKLFGVKKAYAAAGIGSLIALIALAVALFIPKGGRVYNSIAILPLHNDSGDPEQDYFSNGMTERIISELYKVAALDVSPRQDVMRYKNSDKTLKEIAGELNVKALLEASVLKSGDKVRLTARMIDPHRNNKTLWSDVFEREYSEILVLQSDLSQAIVRGIKVAVTPTEKTLLAADRKVIPEAYDLFLKGINRWLAYGRAETFLKIRQDALEYFQKALDIDPNLALAHAWKAHILYQLGAEGHLNEKETLPMAREAAKMALALDDSLAEGRRSLALINLSAWDFSGAESEIRKSFELKPNDGLTRGAYPEVLTAVGKADEAFSFIKREIEEAGKKASGKKYSLTWGMLFFAFGQYQRGLEEIKNVVGSISEPNWALTMWLAVAYSMNNRHSEALEEINKVKDLPAARQDAVFLRQHAAILGRCGRREEALKKIEELRALPSQKNIDPAMSLAFVYAGLGDKDMAFENLDQAWRNRSSELGWLLLQWWLLDLHANPRFDALRAKIGLPKAGRPNK